MAKKYELTEEFLHSSNGDIEFDMYELIKPVAPYTGK